MLLAEASTWVKGAMGAEGTIVVLSILTKGIWSLKSANVNRLWIRSRPDSNTRVTFLSFFPHLPGYCLLEIS